MYLLSIFIFIYLLLRQKKKNKLRINPTKKFYPHFLASSLTLALKDSNIFHTNISHKGENTCIYKQELHVVKSISIHLGSRF